MQPLIYITPITPSTLKSTKVIADKMQSMGWNVIFDSSNNSFGYKIRDAETRSAQLFVLSSYATGRTRLELYTTSGRKIGSYCIGDALAYISKRLNPNKMIANAIPTKTQQESTMNTTAFLAVAMSANQTDPTELFEDIEVDESAIGMMREAMKAAREKIQKENLAELGEAMVAAVKESKQYRETRKQNIRALNARIKEEKTGLDNEKYARTYGVQTGNYLPWLIAVRAADFTRTAAWRALTLEEQKKLSTIPKNWQPSQS